MKTKNKILAFISCAVIFFSCEKETTTTPKTTTTTTTTTAKTATIRVDVTVSDLASTDNCELDKEVQVIIDNDSWSAVKKSDVQLLKDGDFQYDFTGLKEGRYELQIAYRKTGATTWFYKDNSYFVTIDADEEKNGTMEQKIVTLYSADICY
jgi:hypothetical protein